MLATRPNRSKLVFTAVHIKGVTVDTKSGYRLDAEQSFSSETLQPSLTALAPHEIRVFFLHVSDPSASYDEMLLGVNQRNMPAKNSIGLSNFCSWEAILEQVAEMVTGGFKVTNSTVNSRRYRWSCDPSQNLKHAPGSEMEWIREKNDTKAS
ncbi:uncharacterized protein HD556DRAFT_1537080 [Suillus plorans]|uniref:Uncharacterized protein n=1 Tax=Suillus plorans TaxID=116603 RepID=A0A9P7DGK2_9AGAM|nr:uncharacterized protein HD556DRAFT_1537080 [Suillus plorans]KAG1791996.1 hypothetical protein HD556DRAFT_1537080 [Suillus plorans]